MIFLKKRLALLPKGSIMRASAGSWHSFKPTQYRKTMNKKTLTITRLNDSGENETQKWLWLELEYNGDTRDIRFDYDKESEQWNLGADDYFGNEADDVDLDIDFSEVWNTYGFTKTICF